MGSQAAVVLSPALHYSLYSRLRLVHPRADDRKSNSGVTILGISSVVSALGSDHQWNDSKFSSFGFDSKCTFSNAYDLNEF